MYSTSLPPSLKSFTLLNAQARSNTLLQNQRAAAYSANSVQMQQPLQHGDKLQFSGKRLEELKQKRALEAAQQKEKEQALHMAAMQQKMLDEKINIKNE